MSDSNDAKVKLKPVPGAHSYAVCMANSGTISTSDAVDTTTALVVLIIDAFGSTAPCKTSLENHCRSYLSFGYLEDQLH